MKATDKAILCELNILKNRLDAGESIIQSLQTMGVPLSGDQEFLSRWKKLSYLMMEGRVLPAKAVAEFTKQLESKNKLLQLSQQKTISPRIQAYLSASIVFLLILCSILMFPEALKPSFLVLSLSLSLSALSLFCMRKMLKHFEKELSFLDWISFLRSLSLSLECGMTLPHALKENTPALEITRSWPKEIVKKITLDFLESNLESPHFHHRSELWRMAERSWMTLCRNYQCGLPQLNILQKLSDLQEEEFKNWLQIKSEKLSYALLLPLFLLSVPAILVILFAPLLSAIS